MARKNSKVTDKKREVESEEEEEEASTSSEEVDASMMADHDDEGEQQEDRSDDDGEEDSEDGSDDGSEDDGDGDDDENESESEEEEEDEEMSDENKQEKDGDRNNSLSADGSEQCTFDLTNLLAFNTHQINAAQLYSAASKSKLDKEWYTSANVTISSSLPHPVNEALLLEKAAAGTTQLLRELWRLPVEKKSSDVGLMAKLTAADGSAAIKLPRSLPPPPPKKLTKWEQFALQRGIAPKSKRSRKQFDEATGEWKHLTGSLSNKANAGPESWPILEVKKNDDPYADPWEKLREEKKGRVEKNVEARMRNAERAGLLEKGSANRHAKNLKKMEKQREVQRENERKKGLVAPVGVPTDLTQGAKRGKPSTQLALLATQVSTASLGKFDKIREGEPERQFQKNVNRKKRKLEDGSKGGNTDKKVLMTEAQKSQDILQRVMNGSKEKERDVKKGKYAKGETAYDYDYDDGLGAGSFRKKKGRAGMGKMKKVTKKRIK
mmetsp:Transcript_13189/g.27915  ORF Transcript_13189/g.27915 Transcript_13189/m.27915 type:complete len:494 (-) Transcript_13189:419-1900(-)